MSTYASNTTVSPERSQEQIRSTLRSYGASAFGVYERDDRIRVEFEFEHLMIRMEVALPDRDQFKRTKRNQFRNAEGITKAHGQAIRQRWRALLLAIKAKLEAVECELSTIEQEFIPFVVTPDGKTLGQHIVPRLQQVKKTGDWNQLPMLPGKVG